MMGNQDIRISKDFYKVTMAAKPIEIQASLITVLGAPDKFSLLSCKRLQKLTMGKNQMQEREESSNW